MDMIFFIIALAFLTYWSGFFSSSEIALFSLSTSKVKTYRASSNPREVLVAKLLKQPRDLLVTIYMVNTLVNILLQNVSSAMFGLASSWTLRVGFPLFVTLIFGEIIPKYVAMQINTKLSKLVAPTISRLKILIRPLREWTVRVTTPISRLMFFFLKKEEVISKDELNMVLQSSRDSGVLNEDEASLIYGYINLQDSQVHEHMQPREDVIFYSMADPLSKLIHLFVEEECTRIPVCDVDLDTVKGVISAHDFFLFRPTLNEAEDLLPIMSKPFFLPESTPARVLLRRFEERHEQLALIVDEHRSVTGVISVEDIVEEVVGEITDKRDQDNLYERSDSRTVIASAKLELDDVYEIFGIQLESEYNQKTVGGWLTEKLGSIPTVGTKYETEELFFQVLAADAKRLKQIYIHLKESR